MSYTGERFQALSPKYARYKSRHGYPAVPNLTFSGKYLASMALRGTEVGPSPELAGQAEGLSAMRPHIGVSVESVRLTEERLLSLWEESL